MPRPSSVPLEGIDAVPALDSTTIMELGEVPEHLIVLGGGYIGLEFGQMFRRFGSAVTVVERGPRLVPREDEDISDALTAILREDGLEDRTECLGAAYRAECERADSARDRNARGTAHRRRDARARCRGARAEHRAFEPRRGWR